MAVNDGSRSFAVPVEGPYWVGLDPWFGIPISFLLFPIFFSISFLKLLCVMISHWLTVLKHKMPSQILIKNSWIGLVNVVHLCTPECDRASRRIQQGEGASRGLLWAP